MRKLLNSNWLWYVAFSAFVLLMLLMPWIANAANYRTPNFVVSAPTASFAESVAREAEVLRDELAMLWLGQKLPKWAEPCPITLQVGEQLGAGGATTFVFDHGEVFNWQMSIQGSERGILYSVLPHEITHTIFASYFRQPLPRWADEGACTTVEDESERAKQRQMLISFLKEDRGIAFSRMFVMKEYPQDVMPLYAQGYSLCRFLIEQRDRRTFIRFLSEGLQSNQWNVAISNHYGFNDLAALQDRWLDWVRSGSPTRHVAAYQQEEPMDCSNCRDRQMAQQQRGPSTYSQTPKPQLDPYAQMSPPQRNAPPVVVPPATAVAPVVDIAPQPDPAKEPGPADGPTVVHLTEEELIDLVNRMQQQRQSKASDEKCQPSRTNRDEGSKLNDTGRAPESVSAGWLKWLGDVGGAAGTKTLVGLGVSAPVAAIAVYLGRRAFKRAVSRAVAKATGEPEPRPNIVERIIERPVDRVVEQVVEKTRPIFHNRKETENRYVRVETTDAAGEAYRKALAEEAVAHPELAPIFQSVEAGAKQHLNGQRARQRMNLGWEDPQ